MNGRPQVAVVGAGIAGIGAAWYLRNKVDVTLFEAGDTIGGHAFPVEVEDPAGPVSLDMGFLVFNSLTYRTFLQLLEELGVSERITKTDMSISYCDADKNLHFASTGLTGLFHQPKNLLSPRFHRMLVDLLRFRRNAVRDLRQGLVDGPLGEYLQRYSTEFRDNLAVPMATAIWSIPADAVLDFPAESFLQYFDNHLLLEGVPAKRWLTFKTSSVDYLNSFQALFPGKLRTRSTVRAIHRERDEITLEVGSDTERFDAVVLATHADTSLHLLARPSEQERRLLGRWRYQQSPVVLHTDPRMMPPSRSLWRSWNIRIRPVGDVVTYYLNRVQNLQCERDYFVTLGREGIDPACIVEERVFQHPLFDRTSVQTQPLLKELNGVQRTWFCGSYFGYGFHEDALRSARAAADSLIAAIDIPVGGTIQASGM